VEGVTGVGADCRRAGGVISTGEMMTVVVVTGALSCSSMSIRVSSLGRFLLPDDDAFGDTGRFLALPMAISLVAIVVATTLHGGGGKTTRFHYCQKIPGLSRGSNFQILQSCKPFLQTANGTHWHKKVFKVGGKTKILSLYVCILELRS